MTTLEIAHIREQGQEMIIVPLDRTFASKSPGQREMVLRALQFSAAAARLAGTVVPVWDAGGGRMGFIAPRPWHPFFGSLDLRRVQAILNRRLTIG
ncbi:MAG TPA: hypothetical protein VGA37_08900 [Gemmatimonadales bacterium]